ncbi:MAG: restriction endonuclease subunit S [Thermoleophilia bacterium]
MRLKEDVFLGLEVPLPPLAEQQRIVARIEEVAGKVREARALRRQAAERGTALVDSVRANIFLQLGHVAKVGDVCDVLDPNPSHRYPVYVPEGIPIVSSSEFVGSDSIDWSRARSVPEAFYDTTLGRYGVGASDVIFSRKGKVGYARLHPPDVRLALTHTLCVIKPRRDIIDPRYLLHYARSSTFIAQLVGTMNQNTGVPTLGLGVIRRAAIPVPALVEQRRTVAVLDRFGVLGEVLSAAQSDASTQLDALLPAVLDRAFKGTL